MAIYEYGWNKLIANNNNTFWQYVSSQFNKNTSTIKTNNGNIANISRILLLIPPRSNKSILAKLKYHKKTQSFTQATKNNIGMFRDILKMKGIFLKLLTSKIIEIHNITQNNGQKSKPRINMTTKSLSRKQIIILISGNNIKAIISHADYTFSISTNYQNLLNLIL